MLTNCNSLICVHLERKVQVPPAPLGGSDRFRPTKAQTRLNRRISINSAVFSCLKISTQDRHRTEKRPLRTLIRYILVTRNRFEKYDLVICDEFGYVSCDMEGAELLFNHLSLRAEPRSTIITTNLAFSRWNEIIPDKVLVNALVDRLTHKARIINMTGASYRLKQTQQMIKNQI